MAAMLPKAYLRKGKGAKKVRLGEGRKKRNGQDFSAQVKQVLIRKGQGKQSPKNLSHSSERLHQTRGAKCLAQERQTPKRSSILNGLPCAEKGEGRITNPEQGDRMTSP